MHVDLSFCGEDLESDSVPNILVTVCLKKKTYNKMEKYRMLYKQILFTPNFATSFNYIIGVVLFVQNVATVPNLKAKGPHQENPPNLDEDSTELIPQKYQNDNNSIKITQEGGIMFSHTYVAP
jgi:hypothetical protein